MEVLKNNLQLKNNQMFNLIDSTKLEVSINNLKSEKTQMLNHSDSTMMEINPTTINWKLLKNQQLIMINQYQEKIMFMKIIRRLKKITLVDIKKKMKSKNKMDSNPKLHMN